VSNEEVREDKALMANGLRVKRWAFLTVLLYGATLVALTLPLIVAAFSFEKNEWDAHELLNPAALRKLGKEVYSFWIFWLAIGGLMLLQWLFLFAPIEVARQRPVGRRRWTLLAVVAALMMGLLFAGLACAVFESVLQDDFRDHHLLWGLFAGLCAWLFWAVVFVQYAFAKAEDSLLHLAVRALLAGSTAELLIAIPCHVLVRRKGYCCAGLGTFWGLATGFAVLLFAFGPGVFFLFVARARRLRGEAPKETLAPAPALALRRNRHTRDALFWIGVGFLFLLLGVILGLWPGEETSSFFCMARLSFVVMCAMAGVAAWRARREKEPHWLPLLAGLALFWEGILLTVDLGWK